MAQQVWFAQANDKGGEEGPLKEPFWVVPWLVCLLLSMYRRM